MRTELGFLIAVMRMPSASPSFRVGVNPTCVNATCPERFDASDALRALLLPRNVEFDDDGAEGDFREEASRQE